MHSNQRYVKGAITSIWRCLFLLLAAQVAVAQQSDISGIINTCSPVLFIDSTCYQPRITVESSSGFQPGDRILIIQMKGAVVNLDNQPTFGSILYYKTAGKYEVVTIRSVEEKTIVLRSRMLHSYDVSQSVQIVSIPTFKTARVSSTLTAYAWDGRKGGVLAIETSDSLILAADINITGKGFRGGAPSVSYPMDTEFSYAFPYSSRKGGAKGEGCVHTDPDRDAGRGAFANGGGGGNAVNTGGGGGGNHGKGGRGGNQYIGSGTAEVMGLGGYSLFYSNSEQRIFPGGGGGGGHQNDGTGTAGASGGGIVIVRTATLITEGNVSIRSDGLPADTAGNDGAGGGGAGGTILLSAENISGLLKISVRGGDGGSVTNTYTPNHCHGPGGGGSGGIIWINNAAH